MDIMEGPLRTAAPEPEGKELRTSDATGTTPVEDDGSEGMSDVD